MELNDIAFKTSQRLLELHSFFKRNPGVVGPMTLDELAELQDDLSNAVRASYKQ